MAGFTVNLCVSVYAQSVFYSMCFSHDRSFLCSGQIDSNTLLFMPLSLIYSTKYQPHQVKPFFYILPAFHLMWTKNCKKI